MIRTSLCGYLIQKNSLVMKLCFFGKKWLSRNFHLRNCMASIFFMATTKNFPNNIEIAPKFFLFFLTANTILYSNKYFPEIFMQILIFCLHNIVLDTQKLFFFTVSLDNFFKQAKTPISFVWHVFICHDQCLII